MFDCSGQLAQTAQLIMGEHFHNEKVTLRRVFIQRLFLKA